MRLSYRRAVVASLVLLACACSPSEPPPPPPPLQVTLIEESALTISDSVAAVVPLRVRATTSDGRSASNVRVTFAVAAGGGSVSAVSVNTDVNGIAATSWSLGRVVGINRATAAVGQQPGVTFTAVAGPGAPARLGIVTAPDGARVGEPFSQQPVVGVRDQFGNAVVLDSVAVTATLRDDAGVLRGMRTVATVAGLAAFTDLALDGPVGRRTVRFEAVRFQPSDDVDVTLMPPPRSIADRPDDVTGPQVHIIYAVPSDGVDRRLDEEPTLAYSIATAQEWLAGQTGGRIIRMDTFRGAIDVSFVRLSLTDEQVIARGGLDAPSFLAGVGGLAADKLYMVYYDGGSSGTCGFAQFRGRVAALFLRGIPRCGDQRLPEAEGGPPLYWEFAFLHDLTHVLGIVSREAPSFTASNPFHVAEPQDLMYTGAAPWQIGPEMTLDVGGNDYFGNAVPAIATRLDQSPYLTPAPLASRQRAFARDARALGARWPSTKIDLSQLPLHAPLSDSDH